MTRFSLIHEMHETSNILRQFDHGCVTEWVDEINHTKKLFITGEGSSRIFPAKNMISRALHTGKDWQIQTSGAREAAEYFLNDYCVIGASNSGQTRELISLFESLKAKTFGVTATKDSQLTTCCDHLLLLNAGKEHATAATKTVVEQALVYQALLQGDEWSQKNYAADIFDQILETPIEEEIIAYLESASTIYFAGRNNGVAEELTLKTNEIIRKKSDYLEGTYAVHGIEEIMQPDDVLIVIDPFPDEIAKLQQVIQENIGMKIIAISSNDTAFTTIKIPKLAGFDTYFQLVAGWKLLVETGLALKIDLDRPMRARKIGNSI